jgi:xanthine/uracil permease
VHTLLAEHIMAAASTAGATDWIKKNVLGLAILVIGVIVISMAHKRDLGRALTVIAGVMLGLLVVGLSVTGKGENLGVWLAGLVFG